MASRSNAARILRWVIGLTILGCCGLSTLLLFAARAANAQLEPDAAGWEAAARSFHERAALEKERDAARRSPVLLGAVVSGSATAGYVRALQKTWEPKDPPWIGRSLAQLARTYAGPGGEAAITSSERPFVDANRAAVAILVSAVRCEEASWGLDYESEPERWGLPQPRARLLANALSPLGETCLAVAREKALAGDLEGALEHVLAAARWAIDECPGLSWQRRSLTVSSTEHLAWLVTRAEPGALAGHAADMARALDALEAAVPSVLDRIGRERFEHERNMVLISEEFERECGRIPVLGGFFKQYSAPIARAFVSRDERLHLERELYLEAEKAAAVEDPLERRRALEAVDAKWPRRKPTDDASVHFAQVERDVEYERWRLALVRAVLAIEERFARDGRAPDGWAVPEDPRLELPWVYQPRDDRRGWRIVHVSMWDRRPRLVTLFERRAP